MNDDSHVTLTLTKSSANIIAQVLHRYLQFSAVVVENTSNMTGHQLLNIKLATHEYENALILDLLMKQHENSTAQGLTDSTKPHPEK